MFLNWDLFAFSEHIAGFISTEDDEKQQDGEVGFVKVFEFKDGPHIITRCFGDCTEHTSICVAETSRTSVSLWALCFCECGAVTISLSRSQASSSKPIFAVHL